MPRGREGAARGPETPPRPGRPVEGAFGCGSRNRLIGKGFPSPTGRNGGLPAGLTAFPRAC